MLKEALQELAATAVKASLPQPKEIDPTKVYIIINGEGKPELIGNETPWRNHYANDLLTIAAFSAKFKQSAIWYSRDAVVCLIDDTKRREKVTLDIATSNQVVKLKALEEQKPLMSQRDVLFMLRTVFTPAALAKFPKLIDLLRQVKFATGEKSESNVQRGKSSVGKSLQVEASFIEDVPDQITLSIPVFANAFARWTFDVICALEIYEAEQKIQLFPLPGEVEKAVAAGEESLCTALTRAANEVTSSAPIYYGTP